MSTYVIAFESTHAAMATERALAAHAKTTMLPVPKAISAGCGMALKYDAVDDTTALAIARRSPDAHGLARLFRQESAAYEEVAAL